MRTYDELAHFQSRLLDRLSQPGSAEEILRRLRADPSLTPYHDYIASFEPRMVEVAAILVKKWGQPNPLEQTRASGACPCHPTQGRD